MTILPRSHVLCADLQEAARLKGWVIKVSLDAKVVYMIRTLRSVK